MLGFYRLSLAGSAHLQSDAGICQDYNDAVVLPNGWIVAAVADGVGSAAHSEIGSSLAVDTVIDFVSSHVPDIWHEWSLQALLCVAFQEALQTIQERAKTDDQPLRDYDTTLSAVIYNGTNAVFAHVGDGGIIALTPYGDFFLLTKAQKGDEFNSVVPLRAGPERWSFGSTREPICALLLMTDGIYDIVCPWNLARTDQPIYINYVRPFMDTNLLQIKTASDFAAAEQEISAFFAGKDAAYITDDKTIVGLINTDVVPEIKDASYYREPDWQQMAEEHRRRLYEDAPPGNEQAEPLAEAGNEPEPDHEPDVASCEESANPETDNSQNLPVQPQQVDPASQSPGRRCRWFRRIFGRNSKPAQAEDHAEVNNT